MLKLNASQGVSAQRLVTVYGEYGHVGPLTLANPTGGPRAVSVRFQADFQNKLRISIIEQVDKLSLTTT